MAEERVLTKPRHEGSKDRIAEEKHGNGGAESQRQRNLPSEPLVPERPRFRRRGSLESRWRVRLENHAYRGFNIHARGLKSFTSHALRLAADRRTPATGPTKTGSADGGNLGEELSDGSRGPIRLW